MAKNKQHKKARYWLGGLAIFLVLAIFCLWPTKYYIEAPGETASLSQYVKLGNKAGRKNFYLVTVSERPAVMIDYLTSYLRPFDSRYTAQELMGNSNSQEYDQMQNYYMQTSQNNAIYYAAKKAKVKVNQQYLGVYVMSIMTNSKFKHKLKVGDTLTAVNGQKFKSTNELMNYVNNLGPNKQVTLTILRDGKQREFKAATVKLKGTDRSGIGIQLVDRTKVVTDPQIKIDAQDIGGPSAGLMFSLECYQLFTKNTLSTKKVAGTGTIDEKGHVGIIGGIEKKVVSADKAGMKIFFAPTDQPAGVKKSETNYVQAKATAKKIHSKMEIVPVANFEDALNYLQRHN